MKKGDIYYLADQFGAKFVKIKDICDIQDKDDNWVIVITSSWLYSVIVDDKYCKSSQFKKWHFEKLISNFSYSGKFKGCIKINDDIIQSVLNNQKIDVENIPYMEYNISGMIVCKDISKSDFRNLKLNTILS